MMIIAPHDSPNTDGVDPGMQIHLKLLAHKQTTYKLINFSLLHA
jgi:hypothetical protein